MAKANNPTTLAYALLGLLARQDSSGYDLTQGLKDPVGFFWYAQHSQVYPELAKLEAMGLVAFKLIEQSERPDKKVYRLTARGKQQLREWLEAPVEVSKHRDELVLKAYSIWLSDPSAAIHLIQSHRDAHAARLAEYERRLELVRRKPDSQHLTSPWFGTLAVLMRGIGFEREYLAWCEWLLQQLKNSKQPPS